MKKLKVVVSVLLLFGVLVFAGCGSVGNVNTPNGKQGAAPKKQTETFAFSSIVNTDLSKLKYEKIPLPQGCKAIGYVSSFDNFVVFSAGSDKPAAKYAPCLTFIENLYLLDASSKVPKKIATIDKNFVQIDWVGIDSNWIVYREKKYIGSIPQRVWAINRTNGKKHIVFDEERSPANFTVEMPPPVYDFYLSGNYLICFGYSTVLEKGNKNLINSVKLIDMNSGKSKTIFKKVSDWNNKEYVYSVSANVRYLVFNYLWEGKQSIYLYDFSTGRIKDLLTASLVKKPENAGYCSKSFVLADNANYFSAPVILTENDRLIFVVSNSASSSQAELVIAPLSDVSKKSVLQSKISLIGTSFPPHTPGKYIAWTGWTNDYKGILKVFDSETHVLTNVRDITGDLDFVNDSEIIISSIYCDANASNSVRPCLIIINLKENGI